MSSRIRARIVIVTRPSTGTAPFQVTRLPAVATIPASAWASSSSSSGGSRSVSSSPGLSAWGNGPGLRRVTV